MKKNILLVIASFFLLSLCACYTQARRSSRQVEIKHAEKIYEREDPATPDYIWEEPMVDVIKVPPGLDPEGIYYRPEHKEVIEIRQGKWQYYKKPRED